MFSFNLLTEPWIPVLDKSGKIRDVSLSELLLNAHDFREIAHDSPPFVASLLMVCVALLQSAWQGETTIEREDEWERLWNQGQFDAPILIAYFEKWADRFDLFHPHFPFYQTAGMTMENSSALFRLALEENNAGMFANALSQHWQAPSPALACQLLICIQNFGIGLGITSNATVNGEVLETPRFASGSLLKGLTIWPSGRNYFQTLMLNLKPHELNRDDVPCWELDKPHLLRDVPLKSKNDKSKKQKGEIIRCIIPPKGICDLLTLQTRMIRLLPTRHDGKIIVFKVYFTQGRSIEVGETGQILSLHPFKLYDQSKKKGRSVLILNQDKAIWRNSSSLFLRENRLHDERNSMEFAAKQARDRILPTNFPAGLDVVGICTDPRNAASVIMWRHDRLPMPLSLLTDPNTESRMQAAIEDSEVLAREMNRRFRQIAAFLLRPRRFDDKTAPKPDPKQVDNLVNKFDPRRAFWPELENHFLDFLKLLSTDHEKARKEWRAAIQKTSNDCFGAACNALGNGANAVVAVAQVSRFFDLEKILEREQKPKNSRRQTAKKP